METNQEEIEKMVGRGRAADEAIHYTPRAKKVVELSQR